MFKKTIGLAAAALAISGFAVLGNGCSSSSSSTTTDGGSEGDGAVVHKDAGGGTDGGGTTEAPACYDLADAQIGLNGETAPKAAQGVCTSTEISDFFGLCLGESDAADAGGACSDYIDAHANCASCILGPQTADAGAFPVPALVFVSSASVSVNVAGGAIGTASGTISSVNSSGFGGGAAAGDGGNPCLGTGSGTPAPTAGAAGLSFKTVVPDPGALFL